MKSAVQNLFDLYLGRSDRHKTDSLPKDASFQLRKRITVLSRDLPPRNEQFLLDFQQLQFQYPDQDQLRSATESVLLSLVIQCSDHKLQAEFILFALRVLSGISFINWDSFLCSLLSSLSLAEASPQNNQTAYGAPFLNSSTIGNSFNAHISSLVHPTSPLASLHVMNSPSYGIADPSSVNHSPVKISDPSGSSHQMPPPSSSVQRVSVWSCLRQLVCKVVLTGLEHNLKPTTHAQIFSHMLDWIMNWNTKNCDDTDFQTFRVYDQDSSDWLHICLDVIWALVDEEKCRIPFYELLHNSIHFTNNIPDDEALFSLLLEIHRRRDKIATHMQMLDQHLHCPTFSTLRIAPQNFPSNANEPCPSLKPAPLTYSSVLGEPLHGEEVVNSILRGSIDWERALRCLRHAFRTMPSSEWWRRVLSVAPCYRQHIHQQLVVTGILFSAEMVCEAAIDRIMELLQMQNTGISTSQLSRISVDEENCWQQWLSFADLFYFLMRNGYIDFLSFVDKLAARCTKEEQRIIRTNHVTWLLTQVLRIEALSNILAHDPKKTEMTHKFFSLHKEERPSDQSVNNNAPSILLEFISSCQSVHLWRNNLRDHSNSELLQKSKKIDDWWKQTSKGERVLDYLNLDDTTMGMFWVLSHTMTQPSSEALINYLNPPHYSEILLQQPVNQMNERINMMPETHPLPMQFLSGLSLYFCYRLSNQMEEIMFNGQVIPSIAMVETYVRLQLISPHTMFRPYYTLPQKCQSTMNKPGVHLLLFEILNYRLLPLYRYHGKIKSLIYDHAKTIAQNKGKRGEHRLFRLAENLCINMILSLRDVVLVKKDMKGPTDFTETLNRLMVINLAITIKTRGIAELEQMVFLQPLIEQILITSNHTWSEKTMRHFPPLLRDVLKGRLDKRGQSIQSWQQSETTVLNQCQKLLSLSADANYLNTYLSHSFPQHRQYLCAGAWMIMEGHSEGINCGNLGRVLKELSPEEVTSNIYIMVDVLLHRIQIQLQHGHLLQDQLLNASSRLALLLWTHQLLPADIVFLALIDKDDDPHSLRIVVSLLIDRKEFQERVQQYCMIRGSPEHWKSSGPFQRTDPQQALGNHLAGKDRYPLFFDDMVGRVIPVIPLIIYRLIENDATETAERVLAVYAKLMVYHPFRVSFVRDILAYFHGHIPYKLIATILNILDIPKIPFSEGFAQIFTSSNPSCPSSEYFHNLLLGLVGKVIAPIRSSEATSDSKCTFSATSSNRTPMSQFLASKVPENQKVFYQNQDPGTYTQLVLETAVIEVLSLPFSVPQIISSLVQIVVHMQTTQAQFSHSYQSVSSGVSQTSMLPASPSGATGDSVSTNRSNTSVAGLNTGTVSGILSANQDSYVLMIQACGLLLAQLPPTFHAQFYIEAAHAIKDCWWLTDLTMSSSELECAFGYALWDPAWSVQDNTSTTIGNTIALIHAFFNNLPHEWLESTHTIIKQLRPITTIAQLRVAFRIIGPLLSRLALARPLFKKTLALLFSILADVFGRNSQIPAINANEISDLIDFLHHAVIYEAQGSTQNGAKPKPDTLSLCSKAVEHLHPDLQHLLRHLTTDTNSSIYAATHPKLNQRPESPLKGIV